MEQTLPADSGSVRPSLGWRSLRPALRALGPSFVRLYAPVLAALALTAFAALETGVPIRRFTRDPATNLNAAPFVGVLSNVGILLWCAAAVVALFSAAAAGRRAAGRELKPFLLSSGLITSLLLLDDLFLIHEVIFPAYLHVSEETVYVAYGLLIGLHLVAFRRPIRHTPFAHLLLALGFFALSIAVDTLPETLLPWHHLFEDGFKLLGIAGWLDYFLLTGLRALEGDTGPLPSPTP